MQCGKMIRALVVCFVAGVVAGDAQDRHQDLLAASGLRRPGLKYSPGSSLGGFPNTTAGTFFSGVREDMNMNIYIPPR
jgi:hypothetical protein